MIAYDFGRLAYQAGRRRDQCPYRAGTARHQEWNDGWTDAEFDAEDAADAAREAAARARSTPIPGEA